MKKKRLITQVTLEQNERIEREAAKTGDSVAGILRRALVEYWERRDRADAGGAR